MIHDGVRVIESAAVSLWLALKVLFYSAVWFSGLALLIKGREALRAARRAAKEVRLNLELYVVDALLIGPVVALLVRGIRLSVELSHFDLVDQTLWAHAGRGVTLVAVLFAGDFVSYWRHRLEHTRWLWPAHAVHHSDTQMTWLTLARFHPINRLSTAAVDITGLAILGFPAWALVANELVRHYYGEFIHADLPFTYGRLGRLFVSPAMHRWHHARDVVGSGSNFATVFSVFDQAFGTYHLPGLCTVPLGVTDEIGPGLMGQLRFPLVVWFRPVSTRLREVFRPATRRVREESAPQGNR
jgi:sterol desaturase/sphingolipid hydroxylase (fatty acid hydroxylase superfamily)